MTLDNVLTITRAAIPSRNLMSPPDLSRNTPILDVFHPGKIRIIPSFGNDTDIASAHGLDGRVRQRFDFYEPLRREIRLDGGLATIAVPDREFVRFDFFAEVLFPSTPQPPACAPRSD